MRQDGRPSHDLVLSNSKHSVWEHLSSLLRQPCTRSLRNAFARWLMLLSVPAWPASRVAEASRTGLPPGRLPIQPQKRRERERREISHQRQRTAPLARKRSGCAGKCCVQSQTACFQSQTPEVLAFMRQRSPMGNQNELNHSLQQVHKYAWQHSNATSSGLRVLAEVDARPARTGTATVRVFWLATRMSALRMPVPAWPPCT